MNEKKEKEIDTEDTSFPTCPHCGWRDENWFEWIGNMTYGEDTERLCANCEKVFKVFVYPTVEFTTYKIEKNGDSHG